MEWVCFNLRFSPLQSALSGASVGVGGGRTPRVRQRRDHTRRCISAGLLPSFARTHVLCRSAPVHSGSSHSPTRIYLLNFCISNMGTLGLESRLHTFGGCTSITIEMRSGHCIARPLAVQIRHESLSFYNARSSWRQCACRRWTLAEHISRSDDGELRARTPRDGASSIGRRG